MGKVYMYVVDRDFGFAPNPFHGVCTLATCKPPIRKGARIGDWIIGMGGRRLKASGRCVYAMKVTETLTFNEYWASVVFFDKRPVRNGSSVMMVGDNIYHRDRPDVPWVQSDSHHSHPDGSPNPLNVSKDTSADRVLASREFFYFGKAAPAAPSGLLEELGFQNRIGHRVFDGSECGTVLEWVTSHTEAQNSIAADPFDFDKSAKRYTGKGSSIS